jgi:capsular exopolysaccharide synthesis family protein
MNDLKIESADNKVGKISPRELFLKYLHYLPWVIASLATCLALAYTKIRYSPEIYSVSGTLLVSDQKGIGSGSDKFDAFLFDESEKNLFDEIQVIRSRNMAKRVAKSLDMFVQYYNRGNVRSSAIYKSESPVELKIIRLADSSKPFNIGITIHSSGDYSIGKDNTKYKFGQMMSMGTGTFIIDRSPVDLTEFKSSLYDITYAPAEIRAKQLVSSLSVAQAGESTNILEVKYETENPKIGVDIVNSLMREYQNAGLEEKRQEAVGALRFINEQMDTVSSELSSVERNLESYRKQNRVYMPLQQSETYFKSIYETENELTKEGAKLENVNYLLRLLSDSSQPDTQVASQLGIEEPTLLYQIQEFNRLQVQRQTLLRSTTESNPLVRNIDASRSKLRADIIANLSNIRRAFSENMRTLQFKSKQAGSEVSSIPSKEKQLLDITRRQKILEELYSYLLQKKLETSISSASTISNVKVIEPAMPSEAPVKPQKSGIYTMALFLGFLIPSLVIFAIEFFNDKVRTRDDVQKTLSEPIIGEVGHSVDGSAIVVHRDNRKFIAEQFRVIRSNLQYILPIENSQVIVVTSSFSGEGKSFISTNIAAAMSLAGKKTAIMEFDIRKPKIMRALNLTQLQGITSYILGKVGLDEIIVPVPDVDNLYVIPCGPVPPNPAEMLLSPRMDKLFQEIKEKFDFIVIDTAPVGLVTDATILGKFAQASLYIIRHNYTYKKQLLIIKELSATNRLPKVNVIINDISTGGWNGSYYGYGGYGMTSYSYGYNSEYFEDRLKKNDFISRLLGKSH